MKTHAVRLYGENDIRLEEFSLPPPRDDEILARIVSDSVCMSTHKVVLQGSQHRHVPADIAEHPVIIGHEFCGEMIEVGRKWQHRFHIGDKFTVQPKLEYAPRKFRGPGYTYPYFGGDATYAILPDEFIEHDCVLGYSGDAFFLGSLAEPMACIIRAFRASYHCESDTYLPRTGIVDGGNLALLAGCGPMGLGAIDYALHGPRAPRLLVVTCSNEARLKRAKGIFTVQQAAESGVTLHYLNPNEMAHPEPYLLELTHGQGYDDVLVFVPSRELVEQADQILGFDGCLNFFAGPPDRHFAATCNFYNMHYYSHHIMGTFGGTTDDMREALQLMSEGKLNPAAMITHIGGLNSVVETTRNLPLIAGMKKLIYTHLELELTALEEFEEKGRSDPLFAALAEITAENNGLWSAEAERRLLANAEQI
jgi:threonine dehydrogenase-like Zn-dependent dehydrogenase